MRPRPRCPGPRQSPSGALPPGRSLAFSGILLALALVAPAPIQAAVTFVVGVLDRGPCRHSSAPLPADPCCLPPLVLPWPACGPAAWAWWEARTSPASRPTSGKAWAIRWGADLVCQPSLWESTRPRCCYPVRLRPPVRCFPAADHADPRADRDCGKLRGRPLRAGKF